MAIYKIQTKGSNGMVDLPVDAKSLDGHKVEATGVASNTTTIPTTAQVKTYTDGKFVAYDTNAQGLTTTQKSNARTNIGAGTSSLAIGTSSTTAAAGNHAHGNVTNGGDITATGVTIASGDALVIRDSSASKLAKTSITFDGSTTTQFLTKKGTWAAALPKHLHIITIRDSNSTKGYCINFSVWLSTATPYTSTSIGSMIYDIADAYFPGGGEGYPLVSVNGWCRPNNSNAFGVITNCKLSMDEDDYSSMVLEYVYYASSKLASGVIGIYETDQPEVTSISDIVVL